MLFVRLTSGLPTSVETNVPMFAAALHDDVLQCLYNVTIRTQIIKEDLRGGRVLDLDDDVRALLEASEEAVEELRDVIGDLRRSTIGHAGLVDTLRSPC